MAIPGIAPLARSSSAVRIFAAGSGVRVVLHSLSGSLVLFLLVFVPSTPQLWTALAMRRCQRTCVQTGTRDDQAIPSSRPRSAELCVDTDRIMQRRLGRNLNVAVSRRRAPF